MLIGFVHAIAQYNIMILQRPWHTVQDDTFEWSYSKVPYLFITLTAVSLLMYPYVYKYMILGSASREPESVQYWSKSSLIFDVILLLCFK